jgi:hypothetical protein
MVGSRRYLSGGFKKEKLHAFPYHQHCKQDRGFPVSRDVSQVPEQSGRIR